jgi:hypothetical protein
MNAMNWNECNELKWMQWIEMNAMNWNHCNACYYNWIFILEIELNDRCVPHVVFLQMNLWIEMNLWMKGWIEWADVINKCNEWMQ